MLKIYDGSEKNVENQRLQSFIMDDSLFPRIQEYVQKNQIGEGACFSVVDQTGKQLFWVVYVEDLVAGVKWKAPSDYIERFQNNDNLDFTLLDQFRKFYFLNVDEYSVAVAKLLLKYRPDKKILWGDARAKFFFDGGKVKCLNRLYNAGRHMELTDEWMRGKKKAFWGRVYAFIGWKILGILRGRGDCCIVKSDRKNHPGEEGLVYNSQNVAYSLLWKEQRRCLGEKNPDKEIVIIDFPCDQEGIGSIVRFVFTHIMWMTKHGCVPVIHLHNYPNQYLNNPDENMWEYFFEPVSSVTVDDAYKSKNVIIATENDISWNNFQINPYQREYMNIFANKVDFRKSVRFNRETKRYIDAKLPKELRDGERVLGVVLRGTGFRKEVAERYQRSWGKDFVDAETFLQACSYYKDKLKCKYIFLATEDAEYFEMAQEALGDKLLFVDQKRAAHDYAHGAYITLNEAMGMRDGKTAGRDYLAVLQGLAECRALLYNVECGAVRLAWMWKPDEYELFQCINKNWKKDIGE